MYNVLYFYIFRNLRDAKWKLTIGGDTADKCAGLIQFDIVINRVNIIELD